MVPPAPAAIGMDPTGTATSGPTRPPTEGLRITGSATSADRPGPSTRRPASTGATSSTPAARLELAQSRCQGTTSTRSCAGGWTEASTASGSMWPMASSRMPQYATTPRSRRSSRTWIPSKPSTPRAPPRHGPVREHRDLPTMEPPLRPQQVMLLGEVTPRGPTGCPATLCAARSIGPSSCELRSSTGHPGFSFDGAGHARRGAQEISWVLSNHDRSRAASRFGGGETGVRRSLAVTTLFMALGGTPFLYQGEELGLCDGVLRRARTTRCRSGTHARRVVGTGAGRPCPGTAAPTTASPRASRGSTPNRAQPNTPSPARADGNSPLHRYRSLLATRRRHPDLCAGAARVDRDRGSARGRAAARLDGGGRQPGRPSH